MAEGEQVGADHNHFTEMCCGSEAGSYARLIDSGITQRKAQGPSRTCNERGKKERTCFCTGDEEPWGLGVGVEGDGCRVQGVDCGV